MKALIVHIPYEHRGGEDIHVEVLQRAYQHIGVDPIMYPAERTAPEQLLQKSLSSLIGSRAPEDLQALIKAENPLFLHIHNIFPVLGPSFLEWTLATKTAVIMTVHNHRFFCANGLALRDGKICKLCFESDVAWRPMIYNCNGDAKKSAYHSLALTKIRSSNLYSRAVSRFIAPSPYIQDQLIQYGVDRSRISQIMNPVAANETLTEASDGKALIETDVFYAGRLSEEKGIEALLETIKLMPHLKFTIAGGGPLQAAVEHAAKTNKNLNFLGPIDHSDVSRSIQASRIGVLPSICNEILPTFVLESFYYGKPCVVPDLDSTRWLANDPFPGHAAKPGDAQAFAQAIEQALRAGNLNESQTQDLRQKLSFERFCSSLKTTIDRLGLGGF